MFTPKKIFTTAREHGYFYATQQGVIFSWRAHPYNYHYCPDGFLYRDRNGQFALLYLSGHFPLLGILGDDGQVATWIPALFETRAPRLHSLLVNSVIRGTERSLAADPFAWIVTGFQGTFFDSSMIFSSNQELMELIIPIPPSP